MLDIDANPAQVMFVGFQDGVEHAARFRAGADLFGCTGDLFWDPTGGDAADEVLIATLTSSPALHRQTSCWYS